MAIMVGDDGNNSLVGTSGRDLIYRLGGDDTLYADLGGGDSFDDGSGSDTISDANSSFHDCAVGLEAGLGTGASAGQSPGPFACLGRLP